MRDHHGTSFWWRSLFTVFLLQGFLTWFISLPLQVAIAAESPVPWDGLALVGVVIFLAGLTFESIGDWELARFKAKPENKGKVMDQGLWRYTRHPNYFGDALLWWGLFITALPAPNVIYTVLSPLVMTLLLMKVSGVPLLEKRMAETRPKYAEYARKTPAFFPWRPKE
jgi:steroid 5-alpha reductase family enzyme